VAGAHAAAVTDFFSTAARHTLGVALTDRRRHWVAWIGVVAAMVGAERAWAIDPFEIQVYDGTADAPGVAGLEAHLNGVPDGLTSAPAPELAPQGQLHLTFEPSLGMTPFWELGAYLQTALLPDGGLEFAGVKARTKFVTPPGWRPHLRLGCNLEVSYLPARFNTDRWGGEIRPIIAWENRRFLFATNPIVDYTFNGAPPTFEPAAMATVRVGRLVSVGFEYYAATGPVGAPLPWHEQQQYLYEVANLFVVRDLELNFGVGEGLTAASNALTLKMIAGYSIDWLKPFGGPRPLPPPAP
jgi:hypothetical protein